MLACSILFVLVLGEDLASTASFPREMIEPTGIFMKSLYWLPIGFGQFVSNGAALRGSQWLTAVLLLLGAIGWKTRLVIPVAALCYAILYGIMCQYFWFFHQGLVPIYTLLVLSWTPCGDGWSVDRLVKLWRGQPVPAADRATPRYGWARYACWAVLALPYTAAGLSKVRAGGPFWDPTNMRSILYKDCLDPMEFDWDGALRLTAAPDAVFSFLGLSAVLGEALFGLVLVSRIARMVFPVVMILMHGGILLLQNILFADLILLLLTFYNFTAVRKAVGRRLAARRGSIDVLYDGHCPLCQRTKRVLSSFDLFQRLRWVDFRTLDLEDYNHRHGFQFSVEQLESEMGVVSGGRVALGFAGYRVLALALPALWPIAPWLFVPGVAQLGTALYGLIARNRFRLVHCDTTCPVEPPGTRLGRHPEQAPPLGGASRGVAPDEGVTAAAAPQRKPLWAFGAPLAVSGVIVLLALCWAYRVEHFPLTGMPMYQEPRPETIAYYQVLARSESGELSPLFFQRAAGVMHRNGRYRRIIRQCFQQETASACEQFLRARGAAYNERAARGARIVQFEAQKWVWDFRAHPSDPGHGRLVDRLEVSL